MSKKILLIIGLVATSQIATAALWKVFTTASSIDSTHLDGSQVIAIEFDNDGSVWMGTTSYGILHFKPWNYQWNRYNDTTTNFQLPFSEVRAIALDNDGSKWFGTKAGLIHRVGDDFTVHTTSNSTLPSNKINVLRKASDGTIWVGTDNGIMKISGGQWTTINTGNSGLPDNNISSLEFSGTNAWIGTYNKGIVRFDGTNYTAFNVSTGDFYSNQIYSIGIYGDAVLARVAEHISLYQNGVWDTISTDTNIIGLPNIYNRRIVVDQSGNFWTEHGGVGLQSFNSGIFTLYTFDNSGLGDARVFCINVDNHNTVWIGNNGGKLSLFNPAGIPQFVQGIEDDSKLIKANIFPNPITDLLNIEVPPETTISVYDAYGKLISQSQDKTQNTADWKQGVYFIEVEKGELRSRKKFVKI